MADRIFVSYSHHDAALVTPVVRLLRSTNDYVFQDTDSIRPGSRWRGALGDAIRESNLVVVFWCLHAHQSSEVEREYVAAIDAAKAILPVLLDSTPVPPALGEFQWVDFRQLVQHEGPESAVAAAPAPRSPLRGSWLTAAAGFAVLVVALSMWTLLAGRPTDVLDQVGNAPAVQPGEPIPREAPPDASAGPGENPPMPSATPPDAQAADNPSDRFRNYVPWIIPLVVVVVVVMVRRMLRAGPRASVPLHPVSEPAHAAMATSLAREIQMRLTPDRK